MFIDIPSWLQAAEFSRLTFLLEFQHPYPAPPEALLRLRRELRQTGRHLLDREPFALLFDPSVAADPVARRQFQLPGPPFVLQWPDPLPHGFEAGDVLPLTVVFWGEGRQRLGDFARVVRDLGPRGLHCGEGRVELVGIEAMDAGGNRSPLWQPGERLEWLAPPALEARWYLETAPVDVNLKLQFCTPARLLAEGRPLFRASFARLFPFILRRVTSMLHAHCGVVPTIEPRHLVARAATVEVRENRLFWHDWRALEGEGERHDLGGLSGSLSIGGEAIGELFWVLGLGALMNLGKGASFGAGRYLLAR